SQLDALSSMARWMVGLTLSIDCIVAAPSLDSGCRSICSARPHSIWNQALPGIQSSKTPAGSALGGDGVEPPRLTSDLRIMDGAAGRCGRHDLRCCGCLPAP